MNVMHPGLMWGGLAAVALPALVHFLTRPRPRRVPFSAVRFVRQVVNQKRARSRLRDVLVLLLRMTAVVLVALAFARPLFNREPLVSPGTKGEVVRVVLLDTSQSMGIVSAGSPVFERGRAAAGEYLRYHPGLQAGLVLAGARANSVLESVSTNVAALTDALSSAKVKPERLDVQAAIDQCARLMSSAAPGESPRLELLVISDFQRTNWSTADFSSLPKDTKIQFESVLGSEKLSNVSISRVAASGRLEKGREARLEIDVGNYGGKARNVAVEIKINDTPYRTEGLCGADAVTTLSVSVPLPESGWLTGKATLPNVADALAADNERAFVLGVKDAPVYALITREDKKPYRSSSHLLERALLPESGDKNAERVMRIEPKSLDIGALATAAVIVLDHPGKLANDDIVRLAGMVKRGKGMLYVATEPADASNLRLIADAAGSDMKMPVEFTPPPAQMDRRELFVVEWRKDESPFVELGESDSALLTPLRFGGGLASKRAADGLPEDVLATFNDRTAALVHTSCGAGSLTILNCDLLKSTFPSSGAFVPMITEMASRLLKSHGAGDAVLCGEMVNAYLPIEASRSEGLNVYRMTGNQETEVTGESDFSESAGTVLWRWREAGLPGTYVVHRKGEKPLYSVATGIPSVESDPAALEPAVLKDRLAGGRKADFRGAADLPARDDTWAWLLTGCAIAMIGELLVLKAFRS